MTDYPYDFGNGYKVQTVFANKISSGLHGDIYDFQSDAERAHPDEEIITGYRVISEATGFTAEGCKSWNATIYDAIDDYEIHIIPLLEREEPFHLNCPVCNSDGKLLYEVYFTVNTGWLQDYFDMDNYCQLEALIDITDAYDDAEIFMDARKEIDFSGLQVLSLVRDNVKVEWTAIGEGLHGDYNSKDPEDIALLRFYVSVLRDGVWEAKEDGSYCTQLPVSISAEEKLSSLEILLNRFHDVLSSDIDVSIKKVGESMSWLDLDTVFKEMHPFDNSDKVQTVPIVETNVTDNLIKAMVAYGIEYNWCDSDIIDTLIEIGITYDDFCHAGANDFVKEYFEIPLEGRTSLNKLIYSASNRAVSMNSSYNAPEKDSISER